MHKQCHTTLKRRLLRIRHIRFNLKVFENIRRTSIRMAPQTQTLVALQKHMTFSYKLFNNFVMETVPEGQIFNRIWRNSPLKYVVTGKTPTAKVYYDKTAQRLKIVRFCKKIQNRRSLRRHIRRKRTLYPNPLRHNLEIHTTKGGLKSFKKFHLSKYIRHHAYRQQPTRSRFNRKAVARNAVQWTKQLPALKRKLVAKLSTNSQKHRFGRFNSSNSGQIGTVLKKKRKDYRPTGNPRVKRYKWLQINFRKRKNTIFFKSSMASRKGYRISKYSHFRPFWVNKDLKQKRKKHLLIGNAMRFTRLNSRAQVITLLSTTWGHTNTIPTLNRIPWNGWFFENQDRYITMGINRTIKRGHIDNKWHLQALITRLNEAKEKFLEHLKQQQLRRRQKRQGQKTKQYSSLASQSKIETSLQKKRFTKKKSFELQLKTRLFLANKKISPLKAWKLRQVLNSRNAHWHRDDSLRFLYKQSINRAYLPRIHARLPYNPKWRLRQRKPTPKKRAILYTTRMCAVKYLSRNAKLKHQALLLGGQPRLTLRRWYIRTLTSKRSRRRAHRKISRAKKTVARYIRAQERRYALIF